QHRALRRDLGQVTGLAARRRARIEHAGRRAGRGEERDELRGFVLRLEEALLVSLDVERRRRALGKDQRVRAVATGPRIDPGLAEHLLDARGRRLATDDADGGGSLLLIGPAELLRFRRA